MSRLAEIAPRLGAARDALRAHAMRGIHRCSCGWGWRIDGHEYDYDGCFDRLEDAQAIRDRLSEFAAPTSEGRDA